MSHYLFDDAALKRLIIPLIIEQFLAMLVGMVDSIMVASLGEAAVSGVSLIDNLFLLINNIFAALATGGAVVAGQYLGKKCSDKACEAVNQLMIFVVVVGIGLSALSLVFHNQILRVVFGQIEPDVMANARLYLLITSLSIPFIALYSGGAAVFRAMGDSKTSMKMSSVMNIINVAGNAVMIFGMRSGVEGVAVPTLISRMYAGITIVLLLRDQERTLHLAKPFSLKLKWNMLGKIMRIGIPNGMENSMYQLGKILVLSMISTYGTAAITANAICNNLCGLQVLPGIAMNLAMLSVISQCVGAGDPKQVRYYTKKLMKWTHVMMFGTILIMQLLLPLILKLYDVSDTANTYVFYITMLHGCFGLLFWPPSFTLANTLRASNDVMFCMVISIISMWLMRTCGSYVLGTILEFGVVGVWMAMVLDWLVRGGFFLWRFWTDRWRKTANI